MRHFTDYDYALVHLFEDPDEEFAYEYYNFFKTSLEMGREVILDNSIFELGESFELERFFNWVYALQPTEYIIPDVAEDMQATVANAQKWYDLLKEKDGQGLVLKSKAMGVAQGKTFNEILSCYDQLSKMVDKIGISFDCSCYKKSMGEHNPDRLTEEELFMYGRQKFMMTLCEKIHSGVLKKMPVHLLGCFLPQEFYFYGEGYGFIKTLDTSNPVVHGLKEIIYEDRGLTKKCRTKLIDFMHLPSSSITDAQKAAIFTNVQKFKSWVE